MSVVIAQGAKPVMGSEGLTVSTAVVVLTASKYFTFTEALNRGRVSAKQAMITVEAQPVRVSFDPAVAPTSTVGHLFAAGDIIWLESSSQIKNFQIIRQGGSDAAIYVTYFGE